MQARFARFWLPVLLAAILAAGSLAPDAKSQAAKQEITVSAAVSLKDSLEEAARLYHSQKPGVEVHFNLGGSGTLQQQIEQGAPVDVFISASPDEMDRLQAHNLLQPGTRKDLVRNRVVLIVPAGQTAITSFQDLGKPGVRHIAIGEPQTVPAGMYAREILTHLGLYDSLKPKFVLGKDVRQVLTYVSSGNVDAGIVYATDAKISGKVQIVAEAPENSHAPVIYPVAVIKASRNPDEAKHFEEFLLGAEARSVFQKYGFVAPGSRP